MYKIIICSLLHPRLGTSVVPVVNYQISACSNMYEVFIYCEMHKFPRHKFQNNLQLICIANHALLLFTVSSDYFDHLISYSAVQ